MRVGVSFFHRSMRDSTVIYRSFYEAIKELPKENQAEVWAAIFEFSLNFNEIELTGLSKTIFILIKPNLEANMVKWKNGNKAKRKPNESELKAKPKRNRSKKQANEDEDVDEDKDENVELGLFKDEGLKFVDWFLNNHKPAKLTVNDKMKKDWSNVYCKLRSLGKTKDDIKSSVTYARTDSFWQSNFLSPSKLIKKNKDGIMYIDVFMNRANKEVPQENIYKPSERYPIAE